MVGTNNSVQVNSTDNIYTNIEMDSSAIPTTSTFMTTMPTANKSYPVETTVTNSIKAEPTTEKAEKETMIITESPELTTDYATEYIEEPTEIIQNEFVISYDNNQKQNYNNQGVSSLKLSYISKTMYIGDAITIHAHVEPDNYAVSWSCNDSSIINVTDNGTITALKIGTAVITASAGNKTATCTVTVINK